MLIQLFLLKFPLPHNIYKNPFKKIILEKKNVLSRVCQKHQFHDSGSLIIKTLSKRQEESFI